MATLYCRGVPDELYQALSERAAENDSSITRETIRLLERALSLESRGNAELVAAIRSERGRLRPGARGWAEAIREDRDR